MHTTNQGPIPSISIRSLDMPGSDLCAQSKAKGNPKTKQRRIKAQCRCVPLTSHKWHVKFYYFYNHGVWGGAFGDRGVLRTEPGLPPTLKEVPYSDRNPLPAISSWAPHPRVLSGHSWRCLGLYGAPRMEPGPTYARQMPTRHTTAPAL